MCAWDHTSKIIFSLDSRGLFVQTSSSFVHSDFPPPPRLVCGVHVLFKEDAREGV